MKTPAERLFSGWLQVVMKTPAERLFSGWF
jgi:hypothetical protein